MTQKKFMTKKCYDKNMLMTKISYDQNKLIKNKWIAKNKNKLITKNKLWQKWVDDKI